LLLMLLKIGKDCKFLFGCLILSEHIGVPWPCFCYGMFTLSTLFETSSK